VGGGSGVVPLRAILRHHAESGSTAAMHLVQSARTLGDVIYRQELEALVGPRRAVTLTLTRERAASDWAGRRGRIDTALLTEVTWPPSARPHCYVCGPTAFVETVADALVGVGHEPRRIRTERFGPTGG
jgi:ferredoxin-NADP reductase